MKTEATRSGQITIENLLQELVDQCNSESSPDPEQLCRQHPELASEIREVMPALLMMHGCRPVERLSPDFVSGKFTGRTLGNYRLGNEIGRGGMGVVYEAVQMPLGRRVAVKLLADPGNSRHSKDRFEREFRLAASLHHTHIVPVLDAGESDGQLYFAMQLVDGFGLEKWIRNRQTGSASGNNAGIATARNPLTEHGDGFGQGPTHPPVSKPAGPAASANDCLEIARIGAQVADALEHAHQSGICHRDIKPGNILIDQHQQVWVSDFGLAKPIESDSITSSGDIVGTLRYLAPERLRGQCDARSDVYSLGLVLYELVAGVPAFNTRDGPKLLRQLSQPRQIRLPGNLSVPRDLGTLIEKAICPHPEQRYATAAALAQDLTRFRESRPILARKPSLIRSAHLWSRRNPLTAGLAAAILLVLLAGVVTASVLAINWRSSARLATANAISADAERDRARQSLNLTQAALADMTDGLIVDFLASRESMTSGQLDFLDKVLDYNQQLVSLAGSDEQSREGQAHALENVAHIHQLLGNIGLAERKMRESIVAWRDLSTEFPAALQYRMKYATSQNNLGKILVTQNRRSIEAMNNFVQARNILQQLPPIPGFESLISSDLASTHNNIANMLQTAGKPDEAIGQYESAIRLQRSLLEDSPDDHLCQSNLARSLNNLAQTLVEENQTENALQSATEALAIRRKLADAYPRDADAQLDFQGGLATLAEIFKKLNRLDEAMRHLEESAALIRKLAGDYPSVPLYRNRLSGTLHELAELYRAKRLPEQAESFYLEAISINEQLVSEVPNHLSYRGWLAESRRNLALFIRAERPAEAVSLLQAADTEFQAVLKIDPGLRWAKQSRASALVDQAVLLKDQLNEPENALNVYSLCGKLWESLADSHPDHTQYRTFQGGVQYQVAVLHVRLGETDEALVQFDRAEETLQMVQPGEAGHEDARNSLFHVFEGKADLYHSQKEFESSARMWQAAETCAKSKTIANRCRINCALGLARSGRVSDASQIADGMYQSDDLTNTQKLYLARAFAVLAAASDDLSREPYLDKAATLLRQVAVTDRPSIDTLADDAEFIPFWDRIAPD